MCVMWNSAVKGQKLKKLSRDPGQQPRTLYSSLHWEKQRKFFLTWYSTVTISHFVACQDFWIRKWHGIEPMGPYQELSPSIESLQCTSPSHGSILFGTAFLSISGHFSNHMSLQIFLMGSKGSLTLTGPTFWCVSHGPGGSY